MKNIFKRHIAIQSVQSALLKFRTFSKLLFSQRVGTTIIND